MTQIKVKHEGRAQRLIVHEHNMHYLSSMKVPGGYKARYKCLMCPVVRIGKEIYERR